MKTALSLWLFLPSEVELRMAGMAHSTKMDAGEWNLSPHTQRPCLKTNLLGLKSHTSNPSTAEAEGSPRLRLAWATCDTQKT